MKTYILLLLLAFVCLNGPIGAHASSTTEAPNARRQNTLNIRLLQAIQNGKSAKVDKLLRAGANPNLSSSFDLIDGSVEGPVISDCIALRAFGPLLGDKSRLFDLQYLKMIKSLLAHGADVNAKDSQGESTLFQAAFWNETDIIKLLLTKHADIELKDKYGNTALLTALSADSEANGGATCQSESAMLLLKMGANPLDRNRDNQTGLHIMALDTSEDGPRDPSNFMKVARCLISRGVDPWVRDKDGLMAVQLAGDSSISESFRVLLRSAMHKIRPGTLISRSVPT